MPNTPPKALIFDVFGTLLDWRSGVAHQAADAFAAMDLDLDPWAFADAWRGEYQPAMQAIRSGGRSYVALDTLHRENLERVLARLGVLDRFDADRLADLTRAWEQLRPWPDVLPALRGLRERHLLAPCSNGSIGLMVRLARHAGFVWDAILGADLARDYKPEASVYRAACAALRLEPGEVMMVAAHNDDLAAARAVGLGTAFLPRPAEYGQHQDTDLEPTEDWDVLGADLLDIHARLTT